MRIFLFQLINDCHGKNLLIYSRTRGETSNLTTGKAFGNIKVEFKNETFTWISIEYIV